MAHLILVCFLVITPKIHRLDDMIINAVTKIIGSEAAQYSWRSLAQFQNIEFTTNVICTLHKLGEKQKSNAKKQAEQIKYCLIQAKEYYDASKGASLATRPVLLYYCTMSLALAEVLLKQNGDSRLAVLRANHNCHGLTLNISSEPSALESLTDASSKLIAKPQIGPQGLAKGTFEVWRKSAREYPLAGYSKEYQDGGHTSSFRAFFTPENIAPPPLKSKGINLHDCLVNLPCMSDALSRWGSNLNMVRATIKGETYSSENKRLLTVIIHPTSPDLFEAFGRLCKIQPDVVNNLVVTELSSYSSLSYIFAFDLIAGQTISFPHAISINSEDVYFSCTNENLGEFGYMYLALHILGNFARYYPDYWMKHIEMNSPLANAADDLCNHSLTRLPLLTLSELSRKYHVVQK